MDRICTILSSKTYLKNFSKTKAIFENSVSLTVQDTEGENKVEIDRRMPTTVSILKEGTASPKDFPKTKDLRVAELSFKQHKQPAEAEKEIARVSRVQIGSQVWIDGMKQRPQLIQLSFDPALIQLKVQVLSPNKAQ